MINFTSDRDFVSKLKHTIEIKFAKLALLRIEIWSFQNEEQNTFSVCCERLIIFRMIWDFERFKFVLKNTPPISNQKCNIYSCEVSNNYTKLLIRFYYIWCFRDLQMIRGFLTSHKEIVRWHRYTFSVVGKIENILNFFGNLINLNRTIKKMHYFLMVL